MNQINFFQRREFGELVGVAFQFAKQNFLHYFINILLLNLPVIALLIGGAMYVFQDSSLEVLASSIRFGGAAAVLGFILFFSAFVLLWVSYNSAITYNYYLLYIEKGAKKFSLQDLFSAAMGSMFSLLVANLILGAIVSASVVIIGMILGVLGRLGVLIGFVLLFFGINYAVRIAFYPLIIVREKLNVFAAITRSFSIINGHWWQTFGLFFVFGVIDFGLFFGLFFVFGVINYLISNIINTILSIFGIKIFDATIFMGKEIPQIGTVTIVVFAIVQVITSVLSNMFSQTALFAQYGNLLEEKEGVGLKGKVEQIGKTTDNENDEEDF